MDFSPLTLAPAQWQALQDSYATPPRAYHHFGHVRAVLQHCQEVADGPGWTQPAEIYLAVLYHDAIYHAGRKDNEAVRRSWPCRRSHRHRSWPQWMPHASGS